MLDCINQTSSTGLHDLLDVGLFFKTRDQFLLYHSEITFQVLELFIERRSFTNFFSFWINEYFIISYIA